MELRRKCSLFGQAVESVESDLMKVVVGVLLLRNGRSGTWILVPAGGMTLSIEHVLL